MEDLDTVLASRVLPQHRICGYCGKTLSSAVSLRRHIKRSLHHESYHSYLAALFVRNAPLCTAKRSDAYATEQNACQLGRARDQLDPGSAGRDVVYQARMKSRSRLMRGTVDDPFHSLEKCPSWKVRMWQAAGGMPRLITKAHVYPTGPEHSDASLFGQFLTLEPSRVRVFIDGIEDRANAKKKRAHLAAMAYRHGQNGLFNLSESFRIIATAVLDEDERFRIPRIDGDAVPQYAESTEAIWATSGGFTPMHIGQSASRVTRKPLKADPL